MGLFFHSQLSVSINSVYVFPENHPSIQKFDVNKFQQRNNTFNGNQHANHNDIENNEVRKSTQTLSKQPYRRRLRTGKMINHIKTI